MPQTISQHGFVHVVGSRTSGLPWHNLPASLAPLTFYFVRLSRSAHEGWHMARRRTSAKSRIPCACGGNGGRLCLFFPQEVWLHDGDAGVACVDVSAGVELVMDVAERRLRIPDVRGMN